MAGRGDATAWVAGGGGCVGTCAETGGASAETSSAPIASVRISGPLLLGTYIYKRLLVRPGRPRSDDAGAELDRHAVGAKPDLAIECSWFGTWLGPISE